MSLFSSRSAASTPTAEQMLADRTNRRTGGVAVTDATAMRHSAVWACLRLRGDVLSTMPVDTYRKVGDIQVEVPKPPVLINPGGTEMPMHEWLYCTGIDLDRAGNTFGLITVRDGLGLPARIELQDLSTVRVRGTGSRITKVWFGKQEYDPVDVWHERQYPLAGVPLGLSPTAHAAWSITQYLSAQQFAMDWFTGGAIPAAALKNTAKTLTKTESAEVKAQYKATTSAGDVFVHGSDWELKPISATTSDAQFLATQQYGIPDISRFYGCPADLIDAIVSGSSVTYANISQRNLQFLIYHLGPAVVRREWGLSRLVSQGRFVKLNTDAIMRMDPETRAKVLGQKVRDRTLAPSEARALDNLQPFTEDQLAEFDRLFPTRTAPTTTASGVTT